jgi:hypothetical protein
MDHLEASQFLDLDQPRQLGPLFDQAKLHLGECAQCRKAWIECQALKALALEASIQADARLLRRALQEVRKVEVEERLSAEAGPDAAREILLSKRGNAKAPGLAPIALAVLAMGAIAAVYMVSRRPPAPDAPASAKPLPFEFQEGQAAASSSPTAEVQATPALPEQERAENQKLDNEARRMMLTQLKEEHAAAEAAPAFAASAGSPLLLAPGRVRRIHTAAARIGRGRDPGL